MEFGVLGPLLVRTGEGELSLGGAKRRALLARLLLSANRVVASDRLIDDLWAGEPPDNAASTLQSHVYNLRRSLGPDRLHTRGSGYVLEVADGELDSALFESDLARGRAALVAGDGVAASEALVSALSRWRGPAYENVAGVFWATAEAARLEEARAVALESLLDARLSLGAHAEVVGRAEAAVAEFPLRERLWGQLMLALYREGRQAEALRAFQRLRTLLGEELGIEPSAELRQLEQAILTQDRALAAPRSESAPLPAAVSGTLPSGVVTFLLTDVVGSTRLWDAHPADMAQALARHDAIIRSAVDTYGGVLLKARGEGDSTFSVFGRATDAVAAARAAQRGLMSEGWPADAVLAVRMALHTGEAIEREGDYYGPAVNRVARLRGVADGGQILVSRSTTEVVVDHLPADCQLVELGPQVLQDLTRPETVYSLATAAAESPRPPDRIGQQLTRIPLPPVLGGAPFAGFHGRAKERELVAQRVKDIAAGDLRLVLVAGEPGIGKTALAAEAARAAFTTGATVLYGRCDEEVALPYRPWVEAVDYLVAHGDEAILQQVGPRRLAELARIVPVVGERIPGLKPSAGGDAEAERYLLFGAVTALLEAAAVEGPLVLVLDDLHWADKPTLALLRHLVRGAQALPMLVIGTYRHSELSSEHPLADVLAVLRREPNVERLNLAGLGDDDLVAIVEAAAGQELGGAELELIQAVHRETDGNPFFAWELILHLSETGTVALSEGGQWVVSVGLEDMSLPDSVREVIGRRVARLGGGVKPVLATAAVIGRDFDLEVLSAAVEGQPNLVLEALEQAEAAQLVTSVAPGRFTFNHALIPHTLYQDLNPTRRAHIHRQVAGAIEAVDASGTRVAELARHWAEATVTSDSERAIDCARRAGDQALAALAPDEALRWYGNALTLLAERGAPNEGLRCELLLGIGHAQRQVGDSLYRETLLEAAALARDLGDTGRLVRAALGNTREATLAGIVDRDRVAVLEAALDAVGPGDSVDRVRLLAELALQLYFADSVWSRVLADEALAIARRLDDPATVVRVMNRWTFAGACIPDRLDGRRAVIGELLTRSESLGDPVESWRARMNGTMVAFEDGDLDGVRLHMDHLRKVTTEIGQPNLLYLAMEHEIPLSLSSGDLDGADRLVTEHYQLGVDTGQPDALMLYGAELFCVRWHQGREAELVELALQAEREAVDLPAIRSMVALALIGAGRGDEVDIDVGDLDRLAFNGGWAVGMTVWAEVIGRLHAIELARLVFERLVPFPAYVAQAGGFGTGAVAHYLGLLATVLKRYEEAEAYYEQATHIHERIGDPFYVARTQVAWGRMLLERRGSGDVERGVALIERALETAQRYGCAGVEREAAAILDSPASHPDPVIPSNLSAERSTFVGRGQELQTLATMVRADRVVTLTGVGGVGKTRLAIQAAAGLKDNFPDGVWLVELAPLIDAALVATTVASAVSAPPSPVVGAADIVCRFLAPRRALVVLDNCEHVVDATTELVDRLVTEAPHVHVLATSREPLGLAGESVWRVPSLSIEGPDGVGDAVALFTERAAQVRPQFVLDDATTDAVTAVCRRLDGIPLAIELAAARAKVMSVDQIAARLDQRFRLLTRGGRSAVPRQQTLQGAIDWSYELLDPEERAFFDAVGVFAGSFNLGAAAAVAGVDEFEALDLIQQLVDKSMLEVDTTSDRYRLLETLRQYAWDRLATTDRLGGARDRHAAWFLQLSGVQAARMGLSGQQVDALDRLEEDYDNLRAALAHLIEARQVDAAARMVRRLLGLFNIRHPREGYGWFQQIVDISDELPTKTRARLLADAAYAAMTVGDGRVQVRLAQAAVDAGGDDPPAVALWLLSQWNLSLGVVDQAIEFSRRAVAAASASGDATTLVIANAQLLQGLALAGEESEVRRLAADALGRADRLGNPTITASCRLMVAGALAFLGSPGEASGILEGGLADADAGGPIIATATRSLAAFLIDDPKAAARILQPALAMARERVSGSHQLPPLLCAAKILTGVSQHQPAAHILGYYEHYGHLFEGNTTYVDPHMTGFLIAASTTVGTPWAPASHDPVGMGFEVLIDRLTSLMGTDSLTTKLSRGAQLSPSEALELADKAISELL